MAGRAGCPDGRVPILRVLQFNIRAARSETGDVNVSQIAAEIEAVRPDLVSLNEVDSDTTRTRVDEPAELAEATGMQVVYGPNLIYDGGPFGNAILTRYPVVDSQNLRLPRTPGLEPRGMLIAVFSVGGLSRFSSTHLSVERGRRSRLRTARSATSTTMATMATRRDRETVRARHQGRTRGQSLSRRDLPGPFRQSGHRMRNGPERCRGSGSRAERLELRVGQLDRRRGGVGVEVVDARGARDREYDGRPLQQPRERQL